MDSPRLRSPSKQVRFRPPHLCTERGLAAAVGGTPMLPVGCARMPRRSLYRSRVARLGAPFASLALVSAFLLLPLHGLTTLTHRTQASTAASTASAGVGSHAAEDPLHDPGDCPQCRALAQGRTALATAPAPQLTAATALAVALPCAAEDLPHGPALATAQPRAPPARIPTRQT
jgi:hypothetical protein